MNPSLNSLRAFGLALAISAAPQLAQAAPFLFSDEDLLLGVQATGGTGASQNLFFNLGDTVAVKNNPNQGVVGTIGAELAATFGNNWYDRTDLFFGVFGNRSNLSVAIEPGNPPTTEPGRTVYVSRAATVAGGANLRASISSNSLGTGGTSYGSLKTNLLWSDPLNDGTFTATAGGATIMDQVINPVPWNNSWTKWNPPAGAAAFSVFSGGIQNNFGKPPGTTEVLVDVQRMVGSTTATYVTTVGINSNGQIRLFTPSVASAYDTWALTFPGLDTPTKRLPAEDPDNDGFENLVEFVLNGDPSVSSQAIIPSLNAGGSDFVFSFTRRADSVSEVSQVFEYSVDLVDWTTNPPVTVPTTPGTSGFATVGASTGVAPNQVQAVTVTIPKGSNTKLFGRLRAVK